MKKMKDNIDIPFGANNSELKGWEYTIPEGMFAEIKDGKIVVRQKKSEDEWIRKKLIEIIGYFRSRGIDQQLCEEFLAYLEKQKELFESGRGLYYYDGEKTTYCGYPATEENPYDFAMSQQEKQKEQKPLEYLDKDKVYAIMTKLTNLSYSQLIPINSNEYKKIDEITGDVRRLLDYPIEQKSAEWSKEDEEMRQGCIDSVEYELLDNGKDDEVKTDPRIIWLKSLPLNLKKKNEDVAKLCSNGWSEEDELMRSACTIFVQDEKFKGYERSYECVDWLKSLPERFSLQPKSEWSEEDEKLFWGLTAYIPNEELERLGVTRDDILKKLKSISLQPIQLKEAYKEGFQTARHATALAFMKYLDENRPEGKMCLSNGECEEIEKAFLVGDWEKIERYLHKYHWKPSEDEMEALKYVKEHVFLKDSRKWLGLKILYEDLKKL